MFWFCFIELWLIGWWWSSQLFRWLFLFVWLISVSKYNANTSQMTEMRQYAWVWGYWGRDYELVTLTKLLTCCPRTQHRCMSSRWAVPADEPDIPLYVDLLKCSAANILQPTVLMAVSSVIYPVSRSLNSFLCNILLSWASYCV